LEVAIDKLSISMEPDLASVVREAAAEDGVSVSAWLSTAAHDRIRNRLLRRALDAEALEFGPLTSREVDDLITEAFTEAVEVGPKATRRKSA
jgi:hypothetical protein